MGDMQPAARARTRASPRVSASSAQFSGPVGAGQPDEKYLAYMKALRVGRQRAKAASDHAAGNGQSSPVRLTPMASPRNLGDGQQPIIRSSAGKSSTGGQKSAATRGLTRGPSGKALKSSHHEGNPHGNVSMPAERPASSSSDSSDSIDFEVRSIGHVRSIKKTPASASSALRRSAILEESAEEIRDLHRLNDF